LSAFIRCVVAEGLAWGAIVDLEWHDHYELGAPQLDDDHKELLRIMDEARRAVAQGDRTRCAYLLEVLVDKAAEHFGKEEELLGALGWPGLPAHVAYHSELLLQAEFLKSLCERAAERAEIEEHFAAIAEFLIDDLLKGDLEFKSFLREHRADESIFAGK